MAEQADLSHHGSCLCKAVSYRAEGLRDIWFCHCRQCRRVMGHYMASCRTEKDRIEIDGKVGWAMHSGNSEHGFCAQCGTVMFWRQPGEATTSVIAGTLDDTDGIETRGHIFVAEKGDYYTIADGLPQHSHAAPGGC